MGSQACRNRSRKLALLLTSPTAFFTRNRVLSKRFLIIHAHNRLGGGGDGVGGSPGKKRVPICEREKQPISSPARRTKLTYRPFATRRPPRLLLQIRRIQRLEISG